MHLFLLFFIAFENGGYYCTHTYLIENVYCQNSDTLKMDGSLVHFVEKDDMSSPEDNLARRMKNRERQRRYRARKRNEADMRKSLVVAQPTPLHYQQTPVESLSTAMQIESLIPVHNPVNAPSPDCPTRVHCQRDWKKDARSVHLHKKQQVRCNGLYNSATTNPGGNQTPRQCGAKADLISVDSSGATLENDGTQGLSSGRRHWKAEARNRKASE